LKAALLSFYSRFIQVMPWGDLAIRGSWWLLGLTYIAVFIAILAECNPIHSMWQLGPAETLPTCSKGAVSFLTLAACNLGTDILLLVLPFPILLATKLNLRATIQLSFLFGVGLLVIGITIARIPLILGDQMSQRSRSTWAAIEILCGCVVANTAFYYGIIRDLQKKKGTGNASTSNNNQAGDVRFYMQSKVVQQEAFELEHANTPADNSSSRELILNG